jgi:hypothetical protein
MSHLAGGKGSGAGEASHSWNAVVLGQLSAKAVTSFTSFTPLELAQRIFLPPDRQVHAAAAPIGKPSPPRL